MLKQVKTLQGMLVLCFIGVQHCVTNLPSLCKGVQCCKHYNRTMMMLSFLSCYCSMY